MIVLEEVHDFGPVWMEGVNGVKMVKGGILYLQHLNMKVKEVEVNVLLFKFFFTRLWMSNRGKTCLDLIKNRAIIVWLPLMAILPSLTTC